MGYAKWGACRKKKTTTIEKNACEIGESTFYHVKRKKLGHPGKSA